MVRSAKGIEMMVNLINVAYSGMKLLPYTDQIFAAYSNYSVQEFRFVISEQIRTGILYQFRHLIKEVVNKK